MAKDRMMPISGARTNPTRLKHRGQANTKKSMAGSMNALGIATLKDEIGDEPDTLTREEFRRIRGY